MEPVRDIEEIQQLTQDITQLANSCTINKYRCRDLAKRCEVFGRYLGELSNLELVFQLGLKHVLNECKKYLIKACSRSRIVYYLNASAVAADFEVLKRDLDGWMEKINIKIHIAEAFDSADRQREQQRKDDQEFQSDLERASRHTETARMIIAADRIGEPLQKKAEMNADDIQVGDRLYSFHFGEVHEGLFKNRLAALRVIRQAVDNRTLSIIKTGILLTWHLQDCPYILRTHGLVLKEGSWIIVSDYTPFGTLYGLLKQYTLDKRTKIKIATNIALGLLYMHRCNIIHKDLRSHNIAIDKNFIPKITGFEVCRDATYSTVQLQMEPFVKKWWSPERFAGMSSSKASDVYSFGVLLYELSVGTSHVDKRNLEEEMGNVDVKYSEIIRKYLMDDPRNRPSAQSLVNELTELQAAHISHSTK